MEVRTIARAVGLGLVLTCLMTAIPGDVAMAQPLVTGDLSVYYSFDDFENVVPDESGNDPPLNGDIYGIIGRDDSESVRGGASAFIFSEPLDGGEFIAEHFIAMGGCDALENPDACELIPEDRVPSTGYTVATWVKLQDTGGDQSIHQVRSGDGSFVVHAQAQGDKQLRLHLRGQQQADNIAAVKTGAWPEEEWFHYAATYDQADNVWALYLNGDQVAGGPAGENAGNIELGDWGQGSLIGITPDRGRQAYGHFDEYYIFTRAIAPEEVQTLFDLEELVVDSTCDFNADGLCDVVDIDSLGEEIIAGTNAAKFDMNGDGQVDLLDQDNWRQAAAENNGLASAYLNGDSNLDGIVNAGDLNAVGRNWQVAQTTNPWSNGDFNADAVTNVTDLNAMALVWQQEIAAAPAQGAAAVPEPSAVVLLLMAVAGGAGVRRRRR